MELIEVLVCVMLALQTGPGLHWGLSNGFYCLEPCNVNMTEYDYSVVMYILQKVYKGTIWSRRRGNIVMKKASHRLLASVAGRVHNAAYVKLEETVTSLSFRLLGIGIVFPCLYTKYNNTREDPG